MPEVIPAPPPSTIVEGIATFVFGSSLVETTGILNDGNDSDTQAAFISLHAKVSKYLDFTVAQLDATYGEIEDVMHVNSPTFDDDSNPQYFPYVIRMDNNAETMDQNTYYTRSYDSLVQEYMFEGYVNVDYVELTP